MSKSTGRVVDPFHALDRYGPDVMRFYMAHDGGIQDDSSYDNVHIIRLYNKFLNQQLGNLASRVTRGKKWSVRGAVERIGNTPAEYWNEGPGSRFWINSLSTIASKVDASFDAYDPRKALYQVTEFVRSVSGHVRLREHQLISFRQMHSSRCRNRGITHSNLRLANLEKMLTEPYILRPRLCA